MQERRAALHGAFDDAGHVAEAGANVLRVGQVERTIDLVEDVHRRGLELQQGHDQRQRNERPVVLLFDIAFYYLKRGGTHRWSPAQLRQALFPRAAQLNFDLEAIHQVLTV